MKVEVQDFLADADRKVLEYELEDVYVTDHTPVIKKFSTLNSDEDLEYYNYVRAVEEYKANAVKSMEPAKSKLKPGKYELGSL